MRWREGRWWAWRKGKEELKNRSPPHTPFYPVVQKTHPVSSNYQTPMPSGILFSLAIKDPGGEIGWEEKILGSSYGSHCSGRGLWLSSSILYCPWALELAPSSAVSLCWSLVRSLSFLLSTAPWLAEALPQSLVSKPPHSRALCLHSSS